MAASYITSIINLYIFTENRLGTAFGIGTYIRELITALKNSNINICVVNLNSEKPEILSEEIDGIMYWYFPAPVPELRLISYEKQMELYRHNVVYLLRLRIKNNKNLIFHFNYNDSGKLAKELRETFDCNIVSVIHCLEWSFNLFGNITIFKHLLKSLKPEQDELVTERFYNSLNNDKVLFEASDRIICLSENTQQILRNDYLVPFEKTVVIYNGLTNSACNLNKNALMNKYNVPNLPIIIFAGRISILKGLKYALRAFRLVLNTQLCHLIIAGNGEFDSYMEECEDIWLNVTWTGKIDRKKLYDLYCIADIGILPSFTEQCSYVAIEMMMHGLPIIGSTTTGLKEMVIDGDTGLHIPVIEHSDKAEIDSSLLAEKMLYLLQKPDERERMGANARKRYETVYSSEIFRANMLNFYNSLYPIVFEN